MTYQFVKLVNIGYIESLRRTRFNLLAVLIIITRWRMIDKVEANDWNEKVCFCVVFLIVGNR